MSAGAAIGWLQYLEISRSRTDVNITNLGLLTMKTIIQGFNPQESKKREVHLNYTHEENIFQLWRSLRFGSNLEEWLEKISKGIRINSENNRDECIYIDGNDADRLFAG